MQMQINCLVIQSTTYYNVYHVRQTSDTDHEKCSIRNYHRQIFTKCGSIPVSAGMDRVRKEFPGIRWNRDGIYRDDLGLIPFAHQCGCEPGMWSWCPGGLETHYGLGLVSSGLVNALVSISQLSVLASVTLLSCTSHFCKHLT